MEAIMVQRSPSGCYEIPGSAEIEYDWTPPEEAEQVDELKGWGTWETVWRIPGDRDVGERDLWYFVRPDSGWTGDRLTPEAERDAIADFIAWQYPDGAPEGYVTGGERVLYRDDWDTQTSRYQVVDADGHGDGSGTWTRVAEGGA